MQDGKLFSESVLTNIVLEDEHIDYEQLQRCCEIAQIADEINAMPKGFDTMVGENGRGLSGGQKQRLLITRALYRNPQMLFLDEATNALDTVNEARITKALNEAFTDRTVVVVAHRLSTIRNADQIVVMHQGEIVEVGTHEELIQAGRYYTELVASQSDKVLEKKKSLMKVAFLSSCNPLDIQSWSGTLYHMYSNLKKGNDVEWIGGDIYKERLQQYRLRYPNQRFIPELHIDYWTVVLEDFFRYNHFDVIIARDYFFIAELCVDIPIIYIGDTTLDLMKDYLKLPTNFAEFADEVERLAIANASQVIYSSEWAAHNALDHYSASPEKIKIVELGANLSDSSSINSLPIHSECCNILFVARNWETKGGAIIYETYKVLKEKDFRFKLTIIGCNPMWHEENIEIIEYLDKSSPKDLALLYQKYQEANFFLMPTRFDCFGVVYAEAAAFGIPSFGTHVGGVGQVIQNGINGFLFEYSATGEEYANKIIEIYQDVEGYKNLCVTTQQDAKERLNWNVWQKKVEDIIAKVVTSHDQIISTKSVLPTYIINRKVRTDRREHISNEFKGKPEFMINWVEACEHTNGAVGLWNSIRKIVQEAKQQEYEFILICEDDHFFTEHYTPEYLFSNIFHARQQGALLLNGGIGGFGTALPVSTNRYWIDWFWCTQFVIIYRPLFDDILSYEFQEDDTADGILSAITPFKMVLYPFISEQRTFGYSDITEGNKNNPNLILEHFERAKNKLGTFHRISHYFNYR